MRGNVTLGVADAQHGSQIRISLTGKWERVDAFTIREVINPKSEALARKYDLEVVIREYKIGQNFPFRQTGIDAIHLNYSTSYATVVKLYIPGDDVLLEGVKG